MNFNHLESDNIHEKTLNNEFILMNKKMVQINMEMIIKSTLQLFIFK
ncbi:hypothetical protein M153_5000035048 [Pseudoloma neurophilia]|uniref:Uncharacterized protein n=1 Tax=Pseudoloma neurophilia TaxID=146866 RepID=A0A0R0M7I1_9MICR|nr:hypothetical protein M153_5000035048 [Pseudoloma neurophilia]